MFTDRMSHVLLHRVKKQHSSSATPLEVYVSELLSIIHVVSFPHKLILGKLIKLQTQGEWYKLHTIYAYIGCNSLSLCDQKRDKLNIFTIAAVILY